MSTQQCGGCDYKEDDGCGSTMAEPSEVHAENMGPPYRQSVCMVIAQHPQYGQGTGVFCEYKGHPCIITGADLLHRPVAASKAFARFVLPGSGLPIRVSLRPEALFKCVGRRKNLVICACDKPSIPTFAVTPAVPAPAEYAHTVSEFSRRDLAESLHALDLSKPPASIANELYTEGIARSTAVGESRRGHSYTNEVESQPKAYANGWARRCAVVPGTRAWRRPNDPGPIEPFSISVQDDVIYLELVVYCNGGIKRVHRLAVRGGAALPLVADLGGDEAGGNECQGEGEGTELEQDRKEHAGIDDGSLTFYGDEAIPVVVVQRGALDGVHGGPVFLGGKLFGFVLQERVGERAASVLPVSSLGLLPPEDLDPTKTRLRLDKSRKDPHSSFLTPESHAIAPPTTASSPQVDGSKGAAVPSGMGYENCALYKCFCRDLLGVGVACDDTAPGAGRKCSSMSAHRETQKRLRMRALLERMMHLFRHGTASVMEAELSVAGEEELRKLRAADGRSLAHLAAMSERVLPLEFVHLRLQMSVGSEEVPGSGSTALHVAAYSGRIKCLEYLVDQGGDPWKKNRNGQTPAMFAILASRKAALKWLLEHLPNGNTSQDTNRRLVEDLIDMVEDLDEAAVYDSPTYQLLDDALHAENSESEETEDERAGEIPATKIGAAEVRPPAAARSKAESEDAPDESLKATETNIGFEEAWELYARGEMDAKGMFRVLVGIHREGVRSSWPRVVAALPDDVPALVEDLEVERRAVERDRIAAKNRARGQGTRSRCAAEKIALSPDQEDETYLRSAVKKYLRGNMDADQLYREISERIGSATLNTMLTAMARGMPEDKGWALMKVYREHQSKGQSFDATLRSSTRTAALSTVKNTEVGAGEGDFEDDESSVASVFSVRTSNSLDGASTVTRAHPDLEAAVAQFRHGRMKAAELHGLLFKAFGHQLDSIMPAVLGSLPFKKRRELVKISHKGKPSHDALPEANRGKTAPNPAGSPGIAADDHSEGSVGQIALGMETSALARTASKDKGFKYRKNIAKPATGLAAGEKLVKTSSAERTSPFTTRATAWPQEQGDAAETPPTCGKPRRAGGREGRDVSPSAAMDEVDGDGQDSEEESATRRNSAPSTDTEKLMSDFAAGKLATPHFFGAMLDTFGEEKLLGMVPGILKILPKDKADELQSFTAAAEGKAGAAAQSRLDARRRQEMLQADEDQEGQEEQDSEPNQEHQCTEVALEKSKKLFKKEDEEPEEHHNTNTGGALGNEQAEKLPDIIKPPPADRSTVLEAVSKTDEDGERRFDENQLDPWEISLADRRVYDKAFAKLDKDRKGFLSTTEARIPLRKAIRGSLADHQLDEVWRLADTDEDGRLSREEWAIAYHLVRCVVKRDLRLPSTLPKALRSTVVGELPPV